MMKNLKPLHLLGFTKLHLPFPMLLDTAEVREARDKRRDTMVTMIDRGYESTVFLPLKEPFESRFGLWEREI